jgi:hypothetical protein
LRGAETTLQYCTCTAYTVPDPGSLGTKGQNLGQMDKTLINGTKDQEGEDIFGTNGTTINDTIE